MPSRMIRGFAPLAISSLLLVGCSGTQRTASDPAPAPAAPVVAAAAEPATATAPPAPAATTGLVKADQVSMYVTGLSCPFCATNLERSMTKLPGVQDVSVDLGTGEAKVMLIGKDRPTYEQLEKAVKDSGFTFQRFAAQRAESQP